MGRTFVRNQSSVPVVSPVSGGHGARQLPPVLFCLFFAVCFLLFLLLVPVRIQVTPKERVLKSSTWLDPNTSDMDAVSFLGIRYPIKDGYSYQVQEGDDSSVKHLMVWWKYLFLDTTFTCKIPTDYEIAYDVPVYAGQKLDASKLKVKAVYGSDSVSMSHLELPKDTIPMATKVQVPVRTPAGVTTWDAEVMSPSGMTVAYTGDCHIGDDFLKSDVAVDLHYPDGTSHTIQDFEIQNAPLYLSEPVTLTVTSAYGEAEFTIEPKEASDLKVSYPDKVYVGDSLDLTKLTFMDGESAVTDYEVQDPGIIKTQTKLVLNSKHGDGVLVLDPVKIQHTAFVFSDDMDWVDGVTPELTGVALTYEDGTVRDLDESEYTFLQADDKLAAGQSKLWVDYHGLKLSTNVTTVKQSTVDLRNPEIGNDGVKTFGLSDTQLAQLSVLSQRLCGEDLKANAYEASVMANRYDLYGGDQSFFDYILDNGYWGNDARNYATDGDYSANPDVADVFRDVLVNGYRQVPGYVDERSPIGESVVYTKDVSVVEKVTGDTFRFYSSPVSELAYGYSESAYEKVTGQKPVAPEVSNEPVTSEDGNIRIE